MNETTDVDGGKDDEYDWGWGDRLFFEIRQ